MSSIWRVYHVKDCSHARPIPKDKFVAIVCKDLKRMGFFINTKVHPYIQNHPDLLACQAVIEAENHSFLDYNSYVDCIDLYQFEDAVLVDDCGPISKQAKLEIKRAVANSKLLEKRHRELILGS